MVADGRSIYLRRKATRRQLLPWGEVQTLRRNFGCPRWRNSCYRFNRNSYFSISDNRRFFSKSGLLPQGSSCQTCSVCRMYVHTYIPSPPIISGQSIPNSPISSVHRLYIHSFLSNQSISAKKRKNVCLHYGGQSERMSVHRLTHLPSPPIISSKMSCLPNSHDRRTQ
jgi:hypothetical protein